MPYCDPEEYYSVLVNSVYKQSVYHQQTTIHVAAHVQLKPPDIEATLVDRLTWT